MVDTDHKQKPRPKPAESGPVVDTPASETVADQGSSAVLQAELAETKDKLLRALAEQQNIRQQMQRQREEAVKFAASQLTGDLLDTLDNLRRAIESAPREDSDRDAIDPVLKGVEATEANLLTTLSRHGLQRIDPLGSAFDPHVHHAIRQHSDTTAAEGTIVEVLRPAMVGVAVRGRRARRPLIGAAEPRPVEVRLSNISIYMMFQRRAPDPRTLSLFGFFLRLSRRGGECAAAEPRARRSSC